MTTTGEHGASTAGLPAEPITEVTPARRPSPGEAARTLVQHSTRATLSTLALDPAGYPFGSVAPYGILGDGRPVLCISTMAEHTRNLQNDPRASFFVVEEFPQGEAMDNGRLTLIGTAHELEQRDEARAAFLARNPEGASYVDFADFSFWALDVEAVRWVGGFGRMAWCSPEDYRDADPDPTPPVAAFSVRHMNEDHAEVLLDATRAFTGHPDAVSATGMRLDRYGIDVELVTPRGIGFARLPFDEPVADADGVRPAAVALARLARAALSGS
jgi:putative heme iron utilization protein